MRKGVIAGVTTLALSLVLSPAGARSQTRVTAGPAAITFPVGAPIHEVLPPAAADFLRKQLAEHPEADAFGRGIAEAALKSDGWGYSDPSRGVTFFVKVMPTTPGITKRDASDGCASKDAKAWNDAACQNAKAGDWRGYVAERVGAGGGYMVALTLQKPGELFTAAYLSGPPSAGAHDEAMRFIRSVSLDGTALQLDPATH